MRLFIHLSFTLLVTLLPNFLRAQFFPEPSPCAIETSVPLQVIAVTYNHIRGTIKLSNGAEFSIKGGTAPFGKVEQTGQLDYELTPEVNEYLMTMNARSCILFAKHAGILKQRLGNAKLIWSFVRTVYANKAALIIGKVEADYAQELYRDLGFSLREGTIASPSPEPIDPCDQMPTISFNADNVYLDFACDSYRALVLHVRIAGLTDQHQEYTITDNFRRRIIPRSAIHTEDGPLEIRALGQEYSKHAKLRDFGWISETR